MITRLASILALAVLLLVPSLAVARPGDPDPSFGDGGQIVTPFEGLPDLAADALNRIVVVGSTFESNPQDPSDVRSRSFVARYDADGTLDPTFGDGGITQVVPDAYLT